MSYPCGTSTRVCLTGRSSNSLPRKRRLLVTMDKDFGDLAVREGAAHAGVLLLRLEEATGDEKARVVRQILDEHGGRIANHVAVYQSGRLRVRG